MRKNIHHDEMPDIEQRRLQASVVMLSAATIEIAQSRGIAMALNALLATFDNLVVADGCIEAGAAAMRSHADGLPEYAAQVAERNRRRR